MNKKGNITEAYALFIWRHNRVGMCCLRRVRTFFQRIMSQAHCSTLIFTSGVTEEGLGMYPAVASFLQFAPWFSIMYLVLSENETLQQAISPEESLPFPPKRTER